MNGYSWVPITALLCYLFLFLTSFSVKKENKEIKSFMTLMVIMMCWTGGSFAMRTQFWPSVNFWHHVSCLGIYLIAPGYYMFVIDFLEKKTPSRKTFLWVAITVGMFALNYFTGWFTPEPNVVTSNSGTQFIYQYTWHFYLLIAVVLLCLFDMTFIIYRHCKGNRIAYRQLKPIIYGIIIILAGHILAALPMFVGIPLDVISGIIHVFFLFHALYKKHLFKVTQFFTKSNYLCLSLVACIVLSYHAALPLQNFFRNVVGLSNAFTVVAVAAVMAILIIVFYAVISLLFNTLFIRNEQHQQAKIDAFCEDINHTLNASDILQNLTDTIIETTNIERLMIFVEQLDGDFRVEHTANPLDEKNYYIKADHPLVTFFNTQNSSYVNMQDFSRATVYRCLWEKEKALLRTIQAEYFIPLISERHLVGFITLPKRKDEGTYKVADLNIVQALASICATPLKEATAYERAIDDARKDKLTGLINRKYFFELLDREFERYCDTALSLCLINLDNFKLYNNLYGAQEGDIALQRVAGVLLSSLNETCSVARIGGKEFAIILPGYDIHSAKLMTENLAVEIGKINARSGNDIASHITISAGICAAPYMASSAKELFQNAETAVYTVKRSGKNAVQIYSSKIYHQEPKQYKYNSGYKENASTIYALTAAIDAKDHYTFQHSQNVAYYAVELAKAAGMEKDLVEIVKEAALLHDIGKIGIREDILNKPGGLTMDEYEVMKGHVENAVNIIRHLPSLDYVIPTVFSHHEHYNGNGYPRKLKGEEIPVMGRVLCIADSFDAMTSKRSYKKAISAEEAVEILKTEAGKQFDPKLALIFIDLVKNGKVEIRGQQNAEPSEPYDPYDISFDFNIEDVNLD